MELKNLITDDDRNTLHELRRLLPIIKSKYFSLGRDIDKFMQCCVKFGSINDKP
jgi:hypothetical protein